MTVDKPSEKLLSNGFPDGLSTHDSGSVSAVLVPKFNRGIRIPETYDISEIIEIENAVDRTSSIGKRDYAILLLASRLGIRNFMKYRADMGKVVYLPPFQKTKDLYIPYIFSDEELSNIFAIADAYPMTNKFSSIPHIHMEMAVLIRLLYCCGLRLGEALNLKMEHLDLENGVIRIIHSKNKKQRLVPMHETLTNMLKDYCKVIKIYGIDNPFLFPGQSEHLSPITAERQFKKILRKAGIIKGNEDPHKRAPCLHCLRHCFMFHAFKQLETAGYHIDMASPYLSVYCGHESLVESEKYMKFSSELFEEDMLLFADFTESLFPEVDL